MSRLGAIKMRERRMAQQWENAEWTYNPAPETEEEETTALAEDCTEEQAKIACGLALFFLKLNPPTTWWYKYCVEQSCLYAHGSYRHTFWWSLRTFGPDDDDLAESGWEGWEQYFGWKLNQYSERIARSEHEAHPW
jgi:hypothetical protein